MEWWDINTFNFYNMARDPKIIFIDPKCQSRENLTILMRQPEVYLLEVVWISSVYIFLSFETSLYSIRKQWFRAHVSWWIGTRLQCIMARISGSLDVTYTMATGCGTVWNRIAKGGRISNLLWSWKVKMVTFGIMKKEI